MTGLFIIIIAVFLWAGFICAISFMESWLKFRAPGLTMPAGLSVGKLVFSALNKVEWFFAIVIIASIFFTRDTQTSLDVIRLLIIVVILIVQTAWLLPALNTRAKAIISGKTLPKSSLHWYFVIAEFLKLVSLILFGVSFLNSIVQIK
jgi:hypothetical protein